MIVTCSYGFKDNSKDVLSRSYNYFTYVHNNINYYFAATSSKLNEVTPQYSPTRSPVVTPKSKRSSVKPSMCVCICVFVHV